jgi:hypothetical protein
VRRNLKAAVPSSDSADSKSYWIGTIPSTGQVFRDLQRERSIHGPFDSISEAEQALDAVILAEKGGHI